MNSAIHKQTIKYRVSSYVKTHEASLALFLASYGAFYMSTVLLSGWSIADWGKDIATYPPTAINTLLPHSFIEPIFFVSSFPTLIIGAIMLCFFSIRGINPQAASSKQYAAILLTAFGFTYQVIGAWPLGHQADFPWEWQKQIFSNGPAFTWTLWLLSLTILLVGVFSLYKQSVIYHQKHSCEETENGEFLA